MESLGVLVFGCCYGVCLQKDIRNGWITFARFNHFEVGYGTRSPFWYDH